MRKGKTGKLIAFLLAIAMVLCLTACSDNGMEKGKNTAAGNSSVKNTDTSTVVAKVKVGDYITFGKYEQDSNTSNGAEDIEWFVLDVQGDKALVVSKYGLDAMPYNSEKTDTTWEKCTLRNWLNSDFYNDGTVFNDEDRKMICDTEVVGDKYLEWQDKPENNTQDKIFLLSYYELNTLIGKNGWTELSPLKCVPTEYAKSRGVKVEGDDEKYNGNCSWWLRSPGMYDGSAMAFDSKYILQADYSVIESNVAVRPAMWVSIG